MLGVQVTFDLIKLCIIFMVQLVERTVNWHRDQIKGLRPQNPYRSHACDTKQPDKLAYKYANGLRSELYAIKRTKKEMNRNCSCRRCGHHCALYSNADKLEVATNEWDCRCSLFFSLRLRHHYSCFVTSTNFGLATIELLQMPQWWCVERLISFY